MNAPLVSLTDGNAMVDDMGPPELTSLRRGVSDTGVTYTEWDDISSDEMWLQSLGEKDYWGYTYLHKLCNAPKKGPDDPGWDEVRLFNDLLSDECKELAVKSKQNNGWTPLHLACFRKPPKDVVESLIDTFPNVAKSKDVDGRTALHTACYWGASAEIIKTIVDKGGCNSLEAVDDRGRVPLHYACSQGRVCAEAIRFLIEQGGPGTVNKQDNDGKYPFEYIFTSSYDGEALESILDVIFSHPFWDEHSELLQEILLQRPLVVPLKRLISSLGHISFGLLLPKSMRKNVFSRQVMNEAGCDAPKRKLCTTSA